MARPSVCRSQWRSMAWARRIVRGRGHGGKRAAHPEFAADRRQRRELRRLERLVAANLRPPAAAHTSIAAPTPPAVSERDTQCTHTPTGPGVETACACVGQGEPEHTTDVLRLLMLTRRGAYPVPLSLIWASSEGAACTRYTLCGAEECWWSSGMALGTHSRVAVSWQSDTGWQIIQPAPQ